MRRAVCAFLACASLALLCMTSCSSAETADYSLETPVGNIAEDSEIGLEIADRLDIFVLDGIEPEEFDSARQAHSLYFDATLNYMWGKSFARYAGGSELVERVNELYPELGAVAAIPASEFESVMYECFGGDVKLSHKSGKLFRYLDDVQAYVPITAPIAAGAEVTLDEVVETENTYRIYFTCTAGENERKYFALAVKRDDGTFYFDALIAQ